MGYWNGKLPGFFIYESWMLIFFWGGVNQTFFFRCVLVVERSRILAWKCCSAILCNTFFFFFFQQYPGLIFMEYEKNVLTARVHKVKTAGQTHHPNHDCRFHFPNFGQLPGQINKQIHTPWRRIRTPRENLCVWIVFHTPREQERPSSPTHERGHSDDVVRADCCVIFCFGTNFPAIDDFRKELRDNLTVFSYSGRVKFLEGRTPFQTRTWSIPRGH